MKLNTVNTECYANTKMQKLNEHLFAVGYLSSKLFNLAINNSEHVKLSQVAFLAGCFHDIGKIDPEFQKWICKQNLDSESEDGQHIVDSKKFSFEKHPRHNEISLCIIDIIEQITARLSSHQKFCLRHVVYWHHAKPFRITKDFLSSYNVYTSLIDNLGKEGFNYLLNSSIKLINQIFAIALEYDESNSLLCQKINLHNAQLDELVEKHVAKSESDNLLYPKFKNYSTTVFNGLKTEIEFNGYHDLLRSCVISADRIVSNLSATTLHQRIIERNLDNLIQKRESSTNLASDIALGLSYFPESERTAKQHEVSVSLAKKSEFAVLAGAAGCGKTKIALEWAQLTNVKQIIWVCPRVQVCQSIFSELTGTYLKNSNVEILTGEFKFTNNWDNLTPEDSYFKGDVVITTIDQILGAIITHSNVNSLLPFLDAHVVFDEYHEYVNMEIFNLLFAELIAIKNMLNRKNKRTLLVSATPHYTYLSDILNINENDIVEMPSFNNQLYRLNFIEFNESNELDNPFYKTYPNETFVISNTATTAQLGFLRQKDLENNLLFHSKFKRSDKKHVFNEVYSSFKLNGTNKYSVLRSGPIIQASLNISCSYMISEISSAENVLQRLGRLNRFGLNQNISTLEIIVTSDFKNGSHKGKSSWVLNEQHNLKSANAWYLYLSKEQGDKTFYLADMYKLYKSFQFTVGVKAIKQDLDKAISSSLALLNKEVTEPRIVIKGKNSHKKAKLAKNSLRGVSRYIQIAKLDLNDYLKPNFINEYAYSLQDNETCEYDSLTESINIIQGLGSNGKPNSSKNLLSHMLKKHHNVMKTEKLRSESQILNMARNPDTPIYLSYTPEDLENSTGEYSRHPDSIYYAVCDKQAIGTISLKSILFKL